MNDEELKTWLETQYDLNENGCWVWKGSKDRKGYGVSYWKGANKRVHSLYWLLLGKVIPTGLEMCHGHGCSKACFNPEHLTPKTDTDNMMDKHRDGTMVCILTREQVLLIRERNDKNQKELAEEYGVCRSTITDIKNRRSWNWL